MLHVIGHVIWDRLHVFVNFVDGLLVGEIIVCRNIVQNISSDDCRLRCYVRTVMISSHDVVVGVQVLPGEVHDLILLVVVCVVDVSGGAASWCYALTVHKERDIDITPVRIYCEQRRGSRHMHWVVRSKGCRCIRVVRIYMLDSEGTLLGATLFPDQNARLAPVLLVASVVDVVHIHSVMITRWPRVY